MCGINGIVLAPNAAARELNRGLHHDIAAMNRALVHRGPDDDGEYHAPGVALGFRRLSIIDLSAAGHQPMCNEDGTLWLVFNGEIYNHQELLPELRARGHVFRSRSDSEVILHAYEEWGEDCVQRFNGMWAFAIWDTKRQRLFASRDRFGVKPFVYLERDGVFAFSSEVAGLRAAFSLKRANAGKLHDYLAYGYRTNDGQTFFDGVHELPAAHQLTVEAGRVTLKRWWSLPTQRNLVPAQGAAAALRELLTDAVRLRLRSDVPVALLQSGGLDSSAICALVNAEVASGRLGVDAVTAFTAVHPGHAWDESAKVRRLMQSCPHIRSVELAPASADLAQQLPRYVRAMQQPMGSASSYAHWCLMQAVHEAGIKVILNGQGADETLAGYGAYIAGYRLLDLLLSQPGQVPGEMRAIRARLGQRYTTQLAQTAKALLGRRAASRWRARHSEGGARYLAPSFERAHRGRLPDMPMQWGDGNLDAHLRAQIDHYGFNQILNYEDQSSMSQSIEMRSPFVDYRVMSLAMQLPDATRFSQGITKRVLREAFAEVLPSEVVNDHHKIGFATPFDQWAAQPAFKAFVAELVASPEFLRRPWWRGTELAAALTGQRPVPAAFPAWRFITTELWLREFGIGDD
jgi:asparagine synthase (glutamine-hydrolysing)